MTGDRWFVPVAGLAPRESYHSSLAGSRLWRPPNASVVTIIDADRDRWVTFWGKLTTITAFIEGTVQCFG